ncbi:hypothetical protein OAK48_03100 [Deltaproteobacteria bacterium]|nr:hypothetical protein [Deltaproteobacteria bacterium]
MLHIHLPNVESGTFLGLLKRQISVIRWYGWRTSRDSNPEPTD